MGQYKHILIASDLSEQSVCLCDKAQALAEKLGSKLSILHVVEHVPMLYPGGEFVLPLNFEMEENLANEAKINIERQAQHHRIDKKDQWVLFGKESDEIIKFAQTHAVDLIIVGAQDRHGLSLLLSSTTDSVLHAMPCDILAVKMKDKDA